MKPIWYSVTQKCIIKGKLIQYLEYNYLELFNLKEEIVEKYNIAETSPDKLKELLEILDNLREKVNAPVPTDLNPGYSGYQYCNDPLLDKINIISSLFIT